MKRWPFVVLILGIATIAYAQTRPTPNAAPVPGRYQLVTSTVQYETKSGGVADEQHLFLIDSETGRVWSYQHQWWPRNKDGKTVGLPFPSYFNPVPVDQLHGWDSHAALKRWAEDSGKLPPDN